MSTPWENLMLFRGEEMGEQARREGRRCLRRLRRAVGNALLDEPNASQWAQREARLSSVAGSNEILSEFRQNFIKISSNFSKICINFCIQYSIFQHFSKSTKFCKILKKILQKFSQTNWGFLKNLPIWQKCQIVCKIFFNFFQNVHSRPIVDEKNQKSANLLQNFAEFSAEFYRNL